MNYNKLFELTSNLNILYVEDNKDFLLETSEVFSDFFKKVDTSPDGIDAYKKYISYYSLSGKYYDLIITDINMPKLNGIELTKKIYKINPSQKIVVVSAYNDSNYLLEFVNIGIEHFFVKPLNYENITDILYDMFKADKSYVNLNNSYRWNIQKECLEFQDSVVKLTKNEIILLKLFIANGSKVITNEQIILHVQGSENSDISIDTLKPMISRLRKKLPLNKIENSYSNGYKLIF